jgi:mannose-1-phosphate guanylyltransferase
MIDTSAVDSENAPLTEGGNFWAIVLAGGEGVRLRPIVQRVCGDSRPKQYARLLGPRSLLGQTLDRAARAIPAHRTMVVTMPQHAGYIAEELAGRERPVVILQPCDRGTAAGVLYPAHRIGWRDPGAVVAVFPSDHLIVEEARFMAEVTELARWVDRNPSRIVLLAAEPTSPEVEYGWIEPGDRLGSISGGVICAVRTFWEKPPLATARSCLAAGHLWNTSVIVAKVTALLELARVTVPTLDDRLRQLRKFEGTPDEAAAVYQAFQLMAKTDFSRTVLEACSDNLAVFALRGLGWSDLGSPRRVMDAIANLPVRPDWAKELVLSA